MYRIAEHFQGRKLCGFWGFVTIRKSFLHKIWGCSVHWQHRWTVFSMKIVFSANLWRIFSLKSFALYGWLWMYCLMCLVTVCLGMQYAPTIEGWSGIMASIYALECARQFKCYKYTLYIGLQYATRFRSNSKTSIDKNSMHSALAYT